MKFEKVKNAHLATLLLGQFFNIEKRDGPLTSATTGTVSKAASVAAAKEDKEKKKENIQIPCMYL